MSTIITIIIASIPAVASIICSVITLNKGNNEQRLQSIEHKLDVHNGYAEKFGEIAVDIAVIKEQIKELKEKN